MVHTFFLKMASPSKLCIERVIMLHLIWTLPEMKLHYPHCCPTIVLKTSIMLMNLVFFQCLPIYILSTEIRKSATEENIPRLGSLVGPPLMLLVENYKCLLLVKQKILGVLETSRFYHADSGRTKKAEWTVYYLKSGWEK